MRTGMEDMMVFWLSRYLRHGCTGGI